MAVSKIAKIKTSEPVTGETTALSSEPVIYLSAHSGQEIDEAVTWYKKNIKPILDNDKTYLLRNGKLIEVIGGAAWLAEE